MWKVRGTCSRGSRSSISRRSSSSARWSLSPHRSERSTRYTWRRSTSSASMPIACSLQATTAGFPTLRARLGSRSTQWFETGASEDVPGQILVLQDGIEPRLHVRRVDPHDLFLERVGGEAHLIEQLLEHRVQPPRADVLRPLVHVCRDAR